MCYTSTNDNDRGSVYFSWLSFSRARVVPLDLNVCSSSVIRVDTLLERDTRHAEGLYALMILLCSELSTKVRTSRKKGNRITFILPFHNDFDRIFVWFSWKRCLSHYYYDHLPWRLSVYHNSQTTETRTTNDAWIHSSVYEWKCSFCNKLMSN